MMILWLFVEDSDDIWHMTYNIAHNGSRMSITLGAGAIGTPIVLSIFFSDESWM